MNSSDLSKIKIAFRKLQDAKERLDDRLHDLSREIKSFTTLDVHITDVGGDGFCVGYKETILAPVDSIVKAVKEKGFFDETDIIKNQI